MHKKRGRMRKAQALIEYAIVMMLMLFVIIPTSYLFYSYSYQYQQQTRLAQADRVGRTIIKTAEQVYFMGPPAKITIEETMPESVVGLFVNADELTGFYELVLEVQTIEGVSELSFPSKVPLNILPTPELSTPGIKSITIEAKRDEDEQISFIKLQDAVAAGGVPEICDGKDNDLDGFVDEGCDDDNDDYCDAAVTRETPYSCSGTANCCPLGGGDCDDNNAAINPAASEVCDGKDNNCDAATDEGFCALPECTPYNQCSATKPKYCQAGALIDNCAICGCPGLGVCEATGACSLLCSDGTLIEQCSVMKPKYCNEFLELVDTCTICGCAPGTDCVTTGIRAGNCSEAMALISPTDDSYVYEGSKGSNYGPLSYLYTGKSIANRYRTYLMFCNLPAPKSVMLANLTLYRVSSSAMDGDIGFYNIAAWNPAIDYWQESTVTWNNQPFPGAMAAASITRPPSGFVTEGWKIIDVTALFEGLTSNRYFTYYGIDPSGRGRDNCMNILIISDASTTYARFASKEDPSRRMPYINITYIPPHAMRCSDGTRYANCSKTKPKYCDPATGQLIDDCNRCGCPLCKTCSPAGTSCDNLPDYTKEPGCNAIHYSCLGGVCNAWTINKSTACLDASGSCNLCQGSLCPAACSAYGYNSGYALEIKCWNAACLLPATGQTRNCIVSPAYVCSDPYRESYYCDCACYVSP